MLPFHYGYVIVACCCLMMGVNVGLTFSCAGIFYQPVSQSLGVPVGQFGIYMSILYITSTIMLTYAGRILEKFDARWIFTGASALMGLTMGWMALAGSLWEFYSAGAVLGVTMAFLLYMSFPLLLNNWFRVRIGLMIGICCAASGVGGMVFNPIAGWIITEWGWRVAYACFAGLVLLIETPLLAWLLRTTPAEMGLRPFGSELTAAGGDRKAGAGGEEEGIEYKKAVGMWQFYAAIFFSFIMMGVSTLNLFIPKFTLACAFTTEDASIAAAASMAGVTLGKLVLGYINDRSCTLGMLVTTLGGALGLLLIVSAHYWLWCILAGAFMFGWAYAGVTVQTAMLTRNIFGQRSYAHIYSIVSMALAAGGAVAAGGWGLLADATSYEVIFIAGAVALGIGLVTGLAAIFSMKRHPSPTRSVV